jgi:hypothetical protein
MKRTLFSYGMMLTALILMVVQVFFPQLIAGSPDVIAAGFITTSVAWGGKETTDLFLKPLFIGKNPAETDWFTVMLGVQSKQKLNYFGAAQKLLKAYAKGFSAATGVTYTQRTLETVRLKAEAADDALEFYNTVFEQILSKSDWNNLTADQKVGLLQNAIITIIMNGVQSDIFRQAWLADKYKELLTSGVINGSPDTDYNMFDGVWKTIFNNASATPSATQIKRVAVSASAIAQVQTLTMTGTGGTANVTVGGVNYLATFRTDLNTTHADFVALHAAALALRGITLTGTTTAIFTSTIPGEPKPTITITNATSNLAGGVVQTTANTNTAALTAGQSLTILKALYEGAPKVLKNLKVVGAPYGAPTKQDSGNPNKYNKVFLVSDSIYENYLTYLESQTIAPSFVILMDGVEAPTYRGVPVVSMGWDVYLGADFPAASGYLPGYPHRAIYTAVGNLVIGFDTLDQNQALDFWFNKDVEENRYRVKFNMGVNYVHNELMAVAY